MATPLASRCVDISAALITPWSEDASPLCTTDGPADVREKIGGFRCDAEGYHDESREGWQLFWVTLLPLLKLCYDQVVKLGDARAFLGPLHNTCHARRRFNGEKRILDTME